MRTTLSREDHEKLYRFLIESVQVPRSEQGSIYFQSLACLLVMETGARSVEAVSVGVGDVESSKVLIRAVKGSEDRWVPISELLARALRGLVRPLWMEMGLGSRDSSLRGFRRYFEEVTTGLLGRRRTLHELRHSWVRMALDQSGLDILSVARAIGHRNINSTAEYLKDVRGEVVLGGMQGIFAARCTRIIN